MGETESLPASHDAHMGTLALAPAAVAFPVVFCLTYFLCVTPRRAVGLILAGGIPLMAVAIWLDSGGGTTCGTDCLGRQDAAPVAWWLAVSWMLAVGAGTAFGAWRDRAERRATSSRAGAAQPGA
jgi:hypothetical protein